MRAVIGIVDLSFNDGRIERDTRYLLLDTLVTSTARYIGCRVGARNVVIGNARG